MCARMWAHVRVCTYVCVVRSCVWVKVTLAPAHIQIFMDITKHACYWLDQNTVDTCPLTEGCWRWRVQRGVDVDVYSTSSFVRWCLVCPPPVLACLSPKRAPSRLKAAPAVVDGIAQRSRLAESRTSSSSPCGWPGYRRKTVLPTWCQCPRRRRGCRCVWLAKRSRLWALHNKHRSVLGFTSRCGTRGTRHPTF